MEMLESYVTLDTPFQELQDYTLLASEHGVDILGRHFPQTQGGTGPSSDKGWGCMLRCAQMLLGEALLRRHIGPHFEWDRSKPPTGAYERILRLFLDQRTALYSIHMIAQMGVSEEKQVGEWFGPNTAAQVLKKLVVFDDWSDMAVHVALDNILVRDDVETMATTRPSEDTVRIIADKFMNNTLSPPKAQASGEKKWRPLLIIIPLRLGLATINPVYLPAIQKFFKIPQCTGIIGGRPNHALYFIGITGDKLLYLDPHFCQETIKECPEAVSKDFTDDFENISDANEIEDKHTIQTINDTTYHCPTVLGVPFAQVDPSLALTFLCKTRTDFDELSEHLSSSLLQATKPPLFEQLQSRPRYWPQFEPYIGITTPLRINEFHDMGDPDYESDDQFEELCAD